MCADRSQIYPEMSSSANLDKMLCTVSPSVVAVDGREALSVTICEYEPS